ncbi:MAG: RNA-guided pseudouridylation complex pseudouridine synthase subunit Cbf5 [archaeon]
MEELLPFEKVTRNVVVRNEAPTSDEYGKRPELRTVEELINYGIINLNKHSGPTSHQVSDYVKKILNLSKVGHSGTLDPKVTGVLPIALGKGTRIVQTLLNAGKEYVCMMYLHDPVDEDKIRKSLDKVTGRINQLPPRRSAIKRQQRVREIYYLNILEVDGQYVLFRVGCQAGTYIRKLVHDWGLNLKVGAHMVQLVRTKAGPFRDDNWVSLHDLKDAYEVWKSDNNDKLIREVIHHLEYAVSHLPKVWVFDTTVDSLCHGAVLSVPGISKVHSGINPDDLVAVFTLKDELVCLGNALMNSDDMVKKEKGLAIRTSKVFMDTNVYPKYVKKEE